MIYSVKARFDPKKMPEFYRKLNDDTILYQKPDGQEIVESMKRARIIERNMIQWTETCYCNPPLKHERETVYDHFLTDIKTEIVDDYIEYKGKSFLDYLEKLESRNLS
ncbi:MAG: hypothetical protein ACREAE_04275 [Nitrosopumilaceae archaeon]